MFLGGKPSLWWRNAVSLCEERGWRNRATSARCSLCSAILVNSVGLKGPFWPMYPTFVQLSVHIENYSFSKEFTCLLIVCFSQGGWQWAQPTLKVVILEMPSTPPQSSKRVLPWHSRPFLLSIGISLFASFRLADFLIYLNFFNPSIFFFLWKELV